MSKQTPEEMRIIEAITLLKRARNLLKKAGAERVVMKVRRALKSADGARRHAHLVPYRKDYSAQNRT